jgi:hypothetical protein
MYARTSWFCAGGGEWRYGVKYTDRILQRWRIARARPFIPRDARILDIGSSDGELFIRLDRLIRDGMGIDPDLKADTQILGIPLLAGSFPKDMPAVEPFDVIVMLAVLEQFPLRNMES